MKMPFFLRSKRCLPLGFLCFALRSLAQQGLDEFSCHRSNETHIAWRVDPVLSSSSLSSSAAAVRRSTVMTQEECEYQNWTDASRDAYNYLRQNVMPFDLPFLQTLGFHNDDDDDDETLPDGLEDGMIGQTITYALRAKMEFNYTDALPKDIWQEYVLNYANTNEGRSNWRPLLYTKLRSLVANDDMDIPDVVHAVNAQMWKLLAPAGQETIIFKSGSTPLVFDPMSIMAFGYASCTGCSILLVNALRALGVPARLAGTAAWWQDPSQGNHNWVEVWHDGAWYFLEPSPGQENDNVDDLSKPPQSRWFCQPDRFGPWAHNTTLVYAARLTRGTTVVYPLAWEPGNVDVPGQDVSAYYRKVCGNSKGNSDDT